MNLVEEIKAWAMKNYDKGGDVIVETFEDQEIKETFANLQEAKDYCKRRFDYYEDILNA